MDKQTPTPPKPAIADRGFRRPIPLADRRRLMRQSQNAEKPGQVFTDWASI